MIIDFRMKAEKSLKHKIFIHTLLYPLFIQMSPLFSQLLSYCANWFRGGKSASLPVLIVLCGGREMGLNTIWDHTAAQGSERESVGVLSEAVCEEQRLLEWGYISYTKKKKIQHLTSSLSQLRKDVGELSERLIGGENSLTCCLLFLCYRRRRRKGRKTRTAIKRMKTQVEMMTTATSDKSTYGSGWQTLCNAVTIKQRYLCLKNVYMPGLWYAKFNFTNLIARGEYFSYIQSQQNIIAFLPTP